jgi:hypothetical protein
VQNDCHGSYYKHDGSNAMTRQRIHYLPSLGLNRSCSKCSTGSFPSRCESNVLRNRPHKHMPRMASSTAKVGHIHLPSNRSHSRGHKRLSSQDFGILTRRKCRLSRGRRAPSEESEGGHTAALEGGTCSDWFRRLVLTFLGTANLYKGNVPDPGQFHLRSPRDRFPLLFWV